jgi:hypothetical protein
MKIYILSILLLFACCATSIAHGGKKHKKDSASVQADSAKQGHLQSDTVRHHEEVMKVDQSKVTAELSDFPSLHPLIVHFAIVLIIIAAALQMLNLIILKKEIAWIIAGMLLTGFLAAWFASKNFHPHTHGISNHAKLVLEQHDKFADWTIYTVIVGLVLQILYIIFMRYRKMMDAIPVQGSGSFSSKADRGFAVIVAIVLLSSAYCVSRAGHYGAQLVHIEGIGPQGKFLEMEHEH